MGAAPPLPPSMNGAAAPPSGGGPDMMMLAGMSPQQAGAPPSSGQSQISDSVVRMGAEIDQALKLLAQAIPQLAPWVEKTTMELRTQIGQALQGGAVPTSPTPQDNSRFPDGGARL